MADLLSDEDVGLAPSRPTGRIELPPQGALLSDADVGLGDGGGLAAQYLGGFNERLADWVELPYSVTRPLLEPAARAVAQPIARAITGRELPEGRTPSPTEQTADYLRTDLGGPKPVTAAERVARRAGQITSESIPYIAAPYMMPGRGIAAPLPGGGVASAPAVPPMPASTGQGVVDTIVRTAQQAPARTAATEAVSATTAGVGSGVARETDPGDPTTEALAMLAGGIAPTVPMGAVKATAKVAERMPVTGTVIRGIRSTLLPFTEAGGQIRASRRLRELAGDPDEAVRRLGDETISDLSPAQRTGDKRLLALERAILDADARLDDQFADTTRHAARQLREAVEQTGTDVPAGEARKYIEGRRAYLIGLLEERAKQASALAEQRLAKLSPEMRASEASVIVREELESALKAARAQERRLWEEVPKETTVSTEQARDVYSDLTAELPRAQADDMPQIARQMLDPESNRFIGNENSVNEVWGLRSKLLEEARNARAAGNYNSARLADNIADALLDDLGARAGALRGETGEPLRLALDFSRTVAERFRQGSVGRILGSERTGAPSVPPELTLETTVGSGKTRGSVAARDIATAAPSERSEEGVRQYLLGRFNEVVKDGRLSPSAARKFVDDHADILDRFPQMRDDILESASAQEVADRAARRAQASARRLADPRRSRVAEYLGADVDDEIEKVIRSNDPRGFARQLRLLVEKDNSGRAVKGVKTAFADYLIRRASRDFDDMGDPVLSGKALRGLLRDPRVRGAAQEFFSTDEFNRLDRIATELLRIEQSQKGLPNVGGVINDVPASVLNMMVRVLAAQQGRKVAGRLGGGTVQTPGIFSDRAKKLLENITRDKARELLVEAASDRELYRTLLGNLAAPSRRREINRRLNAWLATTGKHLLSEDEDADQNPPR